MMTLARGPAPRKGRGDDSYSSNGVSIPGQVRQIPRMGFPVLPVKWLDLDGLESALIQTAEINAESIRVGARHIKGLHATHLTECVPRNTGVEGVGRQRIVACDQSEPSGGNKEMLIPGHVADGTIAGMNRDSHRGVDLEGHGPTVAAPRMGFEL